MSLFLLPWSGKHSSIDTVRKDFFEVQNRFYILNPLREMLVRTFRIETAPLAPVWRRYRGRFWEELSVWALPLRVQRRLEEFGVVPSPLFGLLGAGDLIPKYPLDWRTEFEGRRLQRFWKERLEDLLPKDETLFDFLREEDRNVLTFPKGCRRVVFEYYRKDRRVINALPHKAYTLRYILEMDVGLEDLHRINFLDYRVEKIEDREEEIKVVLRSEGKYI